MLRVLCMFTSPQVGCRATRAHRSIRREVGALIFFLDEAVHCWSIQLKYKYTMPNVDHSSPAKLKYKNQQLIIGYKPDLTLTRDLHAVPHRIPNPDAQKVERMLNLVVSDWKNVNQRGTNVES